jgi:hypothetical protein
MTDISRYFSFPINVVILGVHCMSFILLFSTFRLLICQRFIIITLIYIYTFFSANNEAACKIWWWFELNLTWCLKNHYFITYHFGIRHFVTKAMFSWLLFLGERDHAWDTWATRRKTHDISGQSQDGHGKSSF